MTSVHYFVIGNEKVVDCRNRICIDSVALFICSNGAFLK